jgi:large subunit ribosomal protein L27
MWFTLYNLWYIVYHELMAHKKAGGTTSNIRDSQGQRLGVKLFSGEFAPAGAIIVRQRGTRIRPGRNVSIGNDDSLFAKMSGIVTYRTIKRRRFDGSIKQSRFVDVKPESLVKSKK